MTRTEPRRPRLYRLPDRGWIAGVCAGLAEYFGVSVRWIRVIAVLGLVFGGFFPLAIVYGALWYAMEPASGDRETGSVPRTPEHSTRAAGPATTSATDPESLDRTFARLERRLRDLEAGVTAPEFELKRALRELESGRS